MLIEAAPNAERPRRTIVDLLQRDYRILRKARLLLLVEKESLWSNSTRLGRRHRGVLVIRIHGESLGWDVARSECLESRAYVSQTSVWEMARVDMRMVDAEVRCDSQVVRDRMEQRAVTRCASGEVEVEDSEWNRRAMALVVWKVVRTCLWHEREQYGVVVKGELGIEVRQDDDKLRSRRKEM